VLVGQPDISITIGTPHYFLIKLLFSYLETQQLYGRPVKRIPKDPLRGEDFVYTEKLSILF